MSLPVAETNERFVKGERLNFVPSGKRFRSNFIEPGVVDYSDCGCGIELLRRETIEKALNTALGNPLTKGHISTRLNAFDGVALGYVDKVGYDEASRMYCCEGTVESDEGRALIQSGKEPSCGYTVLSFGPGGRYNNVPYEREITAIKFHHLAIVDNPRYQEGDIRLNSTKPAMNVFKYIVKKLRPASEAGGAEQHVDEPGELPADTTIDVGGKPVRLNELVAARVEADAAEARKNAISGDTRIEYAPGKFATMTELTASFRANEKKDDDMSDEDKKKKADADRENAVAEQKKKDAAENEKRENAASFRIIQEARKAPPVPTRERANSAGTLEENLARGQSRYGSVANGKN